LAGLYRLYNFGLAPIFFYVEAVFSLQGFFLCSLYLIAWKLSGTWLAGVNVIQLFFFFSDAPVN
jgi:hypothetical protein